MPSKKSEHLELQNIVEVLDEDEFIITVEFLKRCTFLRSFLHLFLIDKCWL